MNKNIQTGSIFNCNNLHIGDIIVDNQVIYKDQFTMKEDIYIYFFDPLKTLFKKNKDKVEVNTYILELYNLMGIVECLHLGINIEYDEKSILNKVKNFYTKSYIFFRKRVLENPEKLFINFSEALYQKEIGRLNDYYKLISEYYNIDCPINFNDAELYVWGEKIKDIIRENIF